MHDPAQVRDHLSRQPEQSKDHATDYAVVAEKLIAAVQDEIGMLHFIYTKRGALTGNVDEHDNVLPMTKAEINGQLGALVKTHPPMQAGVEAMPRALKDQSVIRMVGVPQANIPDIDPLNFNSLRIVGVAKNDRAVIARGCCTDTFDLATAEVMIGAAFKAPAPRTREGVMEAWRKIADETVNSIGGNFPGLLAIAPSDKAKDLVRLLVTAMRQLNNLESLERFERHLVGCLEAAPLDYLVDSRAGFTKSNWRVAERDGCDGFAQLMYESAIIAAHCMRQEPPALNFASAQKRVRALHVLDDAGLMVIFGRTEAVESLADSIITKLKIVAP